MSHLHYNYNAADPAAYLRLLVPLQGLEKHHSAKILWDKFKTKAQNSLRLPDTNGELTLVISNARFINVSVGTEKAIRLLQETTFKENLVHTSINKDEKVKKVLRELKCESYDDS